MFVVCQYCHSRLSHFKDSYNSSNQVEATRLSWLPCDPAGLLTAMPGRVGVSPGQRLPSSAPTGQWFSAMVARCRDEQGTSEVRVNDRSVRDVPGSWR